MTTSFYDEIFDFLNKETQKLGYLGCKEKSLEDKIDDYHDLVMGQNDPLREIESQIPIQDFYDLNLPTYTIPRIHSPLSVGEIQKYSDELKAPKNLSKLVKFHYVDKALLYLYGRHKPPTGRHIVLFTWVMPGGLGDWMAQLEAANILRKSFGDLPIRLVTLVHEKEAYKLDLGLTNCHILRYKTDEPIDFPQAVTELMKTSSLVLQLPTLYPFWETPSGPSYELVGEYGFIDSPWCHIATKARSMGLHGLEKGVLIKEMPEPSFEEIAYLFPDNKVTPFHFAYLITDRGHFLFIKALLSLYKKNHDDITLVVPHVDKILQLIHKHREIFEDSFIKEIHIYSERRFCSVPFHSVGKTLRVIHTPKLPPKECRKLLVLSRDFVACRGDQSFSEVTSSQKIFFYDALDHAIPFLKDLVALAEDRIPMYQSAIDYLKLFIPSDASLHEVADAMSYYLEVPETTIGLKKLHQAICQDYNFNPTLVNLTARALHHYHHPEIIAAEEEALQGFYDGHLTFKEFIVSFSGYLDGIFD